MPGGGTTDYAVEIFYEALKNKKYTCFLGPDSSLPMMYMPDCLKATLDLLLFEGKLQNSVFNVTAMSFTPAEMAEAIKEVRLFACFCVYVGASTKLSLVIL